MAVIIELHGSRTFNVNVTGGTAKFLYYIGNEPDEAAAYNLVLANSPGTWYGYTRDDINMDNRPTLDQWWPVVTYKLPVYEIGSTPPTADGGGGASPPGSSPPTPADNAEIEGMSISIALENQHITQSLETISRTARAGGAAPDCGGVIGITEDKKVEGVDIGVPVATIQKRTTLPFLSVGYFKNLLWLCGKTNNADWWAFKQEELLFTGCQGQSKGTGEFELNYEFKYIRNRSLVSIDNGAILVPGKKGWHYLWVAYEKNIQANRLVPRPLAAYVEKVYQSEDFTFIGDIFV